MKKISTFSSKGSKKFLLRTFLVVLISVSLMILDQLELRDYIFIICISIYIIALMHCKYVE